MLSILFLLLLFSYISIPSKKLNKLGSLIYLSALYITLTVYCWKNSNLQIMQLNLWFFPKNITSQNNLIAIFIALILGIIVLITSWLKKKKYIVLFSTNRIKKWCLILISLLFTFTGTLLFRSSYWAMSYFGDLQIDQIIYTLTQPMTGTDPGQIREFIVQPLLSTVIITLIVGYLLFQLSTYSFQFKTQKHRKKKGYNGLIIGIGTLVLCLGTTLGVRELGYADIKAYFFEDSTIYNDYYVDPDTVEIIFPDKKRNLIYIFLESMESSYASKDLGGVKDKNLIPNLSNLALNEGVHFSNNDQLGGMLNTPSTTFTAGGMVAQTAGIPLRMSSGISPNNYGTGDNLYLPGAKSIGSLLEKQGYNQTLFIGSEATFASRDKYFIQHGNYSIEDYTWAKKTDLIPNDYRVWWGYEDQKLFEFAKSTLTNLSTEDAPFNFTMLTADTHFEDGLMTENTPQIFDDQYSNVIHFSDSQVMNFINWIKEQPFYSNTTIVIAGDHLTMDRDFFENIDPNYQRTVYNVILNSAISTDDTKNRLFSPMDMFPTTLAALGVEIAENRLGLGTNLFSDLPTITENLGYSEFYSELTKRSTFYEKNILQGTDRQ